MSDMPRHMFHMNRQVSEHASNWYGLVDASHTPKGVHLGLPATTLSDLYLHQYKLHTTGPYILASRTKHKSWLLLANPVSQLVMEISYRSLVAVIYYLSLFLKQNTLKVNQQIILYFHFISSLCVPLIHLIDNLVTNCLDTVLFFDTITGFDGRVYNVNRAS